MKNVKVELNPVNENEIITTTVETSARYKGYNHYSPAYCDMIVDDFKEVNKAWTTKKSREGFEALDTNENWEPEGESLQEDLESFQKYLDEEYGEGKYEAYTLGAYVHGSVSFAFNKGEDTRCRWDSGTIGFVGVPTDGTYKEHLNHIASELSDAWNGCLSELQVFDEYNDELLDSIMSSESWGDIKKWKEEMKEKYGVTEYAEDNAY